MLNYWAFGKFGSLPDVRFVFRKDGMVKIWAGDPVFTANQLSVDVAYWTTLWALIKNLPRMLWR